MAGKAVPLVLLNMGGEMIYIIHQRLGAQGIPSEKAEKVLSDIVGALCSPPFVDEMFKLQRLCTQATAKAVFERIVHSSIMKLSPDSMDKMFDLMIMVFKYQLYNCKSPHELLWMTMNHLRGIRNVVYRPQVVGSVSLLGKKFIEVYKPLPPWDLHLLRCQLLNWAENLHIKVSNFLKDGKQDTHGNFIIPEGGSVGYAMEVPGEIKFFKGGTIDGRHFETVVDFVEEETAGTLEWDGETGTDLGMNIYESSNMPETEKPHEEETPSTAFGKIAGVGGKKFYAPTAEVLHATEELNLLSRLVDGGAATREGGMFKLTLFSGSQGDMSPDESTGAQTRTAVIDSRIRSTNEELSRVFNELDVTVNQPSADADSLLNLMDEALKM